MDIPGQEKLKAEQVEEVKRIKSLFKNETRFKFEKIIGAGARGFALEMRVIDQSGPSLIKKQMARFVMKRATSKVHEQTVKREIEILQRLRGAQNIQQLYRLPDDEGDLKATYLQGPTLFTEWIPNGIIRELLEGRDDWSHPLPNRMLWRFFLCFCNMLVAMAWPPEGKEDAPSAKRELPPQDPSGDRPSKSTLRHNDLNIENVMFGDFNSITHEHVPMLKLIDFGQASESSDSFTYTPEQAVKENMFRIAGVMLNLVGGAIDMTNAGMMNMDVTVKGEKKTIRSRARDLDGLNPKWKAPGRLINRHTGWMNNLDTDLRDLLVRCLAANATMRPDLEELFEDVQRNVTRKTQSSYIGKRWHNNESDSELLRISKELIIDRGAKT
ncbi:hypothetical protein F4781DRAFT_411942 [Annulohypoxylon bovei var. microspora]|nr:hypothetical protein F4781DRAFT_411942 [Annulohypoxylon bovei var. microspora]